jgi:hypothetical protein
VGIWPDVFAHEEPTRVWLEPQASQTNLPRTGLELTDQAEVEALEKKAINHVGTERAQSSLVNGFYA